MVFCCTFIADTVNFLGISIVGQTNKGGDGGIYVGSIMKGLVCLLMVLFHKINAEMYCLYFIAFCKVQRKNED